MAAIIIQFIRDNADVLQTLEGRDLYRACSLAIKDSPWVDVLFGLEPTKEEQERRKANDEKLDAYWKEFVETAKADEPREDWEIFNMRAISRDEFLNMLKIEPESYQTMIGIIKARQYFKGSEE